MYIRVNVTAGAKKERITKLAPDKYDIWVKEPAERNLANSRVRELLILEFGLPKGSVRLVTGHHSPHKIFSVEKEG